MTTDEHAQPAPPTWLHAVTPGTLDRRILDQHQFWVTGDGTVLHLHDMSPEHLRNVVTMAENMAVELHFHAMLDSFADLVIGDLTGHPSGERLALELTGTSLVDMTPRDWLPTIALIRAINHELQRRPDAGPASAP